MASSTAPAPPPTRDLRGRPPRSSRSGVTRARRLIAAGAAVAGLAVGAAACSSDDVVATGAAPAGNPESPAADNPTTSAAVTSIAPGTTVEVPTAPTTSPKPAASTSTPVTSVPPASSVPGPVDPAAGMNARVFWVRAPGDPRVIDIPGYRDPTSGPLPLVVYGSVTNDGVATVVRPYVTASFLDASGTPAATFSADVVAPGSTSPLAFLAPGETGDVIIVVTDPATSAALADLTPELTGAAR